jgi:hypothetical protein
LHGHRDNEFSIHPDPQAGPSVCTGNAGRKVGFIFQYMPVMLERMAIMLYGGIFLTSPSNQHLQS